MLGEGAGDRRPPAELADVGGGGGALHLQQPGVPPRDVDEVEHLGACAVVGDDAVVEDLEVGQLRHAAASRHLHARLVLPGHLQPAELRSDALLAELARRRAEVAEEVAADAARAPLSRL